jgi:hypothetical protein
MRDLAIRSRAAALERDLARLDELEAELTRLQSWAETHARSWGLRAEYYAWAGEVLRSMREPL